LGGTELSDEVVDGGFLRVAALLAESLEDDAGLYGRVLLEPALHVGADSFELARAPHARRSPLVHRLRVSDRLFLDNSPNHALTHAGLLCHFFHRQLS